MIEATWAKCCKRNVVSWLIRPGVATRFAADCRGSLSIIKQCLTSTLCSCGLWQSDQLCIVLELKGSSEVPRVGFDGAATP